MAARIENSVFEGDYFADFSGEDMGTRKSFVEFVARKNLEGLGGVGNAFRKESATIAHDLKLLPIERTGMRKISEPNTWSWGSSAWSDGSYGIVLVSPQEEPARDLLLAATSVAIGPFETRLRSKKLNKEIRFANVPVVVQLQGVSTERFKPKESEDPKVRLRNLLKARLEHREASEILGQYRWEQLLVTLVMEWAQRMGYPELYILPAENNSYYELKPQYKDKLRLRYNHTAERMGFRMRDNGLYGITLP